MHSSNSFPILRCFYKVYLYWSGLSNPDKTVHYSLEAQSELLASPFFSLEKTPEQERPDASSTVCTDIIGPLLSPPNLPAFYFSLCCIQTQKKNEKIYVNPCPRLIKAWSMACLWFQIEVSPVGSLDSNLCRQSVPTFRECWYLFLWPFWPSEIEWKPYTVLPLKWKIIHENE